MKGIERIMSTALMSPRKNKRSNASMAIAKAIIDEYQPTNAEEMQNALKDIFGPMFEAIDVYKRQVSKKSAKNISCEMIVNSVTG